MVHPKIAKTGNNKITNHFRHFGHLRNSRSPLSQMNGVQTATSLKCFSWGLLDAQFRRFCLFTYLAKWKWPFCYPSKNIIQGLSFQNIYIIALHKISKIVLIAFYMDETVNPSFKFGGWLEWQISKAEVGLRTELRNPCFVRVYGLLALMNTSIMNARCSP